MRFFGRVQNSGSKSISDQEFLEAFKRLECHAFVLVPSVFMKTEQGLALLLFRTVEQAYDLGAKTQSPFPFVVNKVDRIALDYNFDLLAIAKTSAG
jgi:hypothetical protein